MAGPVFDDLSVKSHHTVYWAWAISTLLVGEAIFGIFNCILILAMASAFRAGGGTPTPCGCLRGHWVTISTIVS